MKKQLLPLIAIATLSATSFSAQAADIPSQGSKAYVIDQDGDIVRDRFGRCVRTIDWSMETALASCEGGKPKAEKVAKTESKPTPVIAPIKAAPKPVVVAAPVPAPLPVIAPKAPMVDEPVAPNVPAQFRGFFNTDSAKLKSQAFADLDVYANYLKRMPSHSVKITGHTDSVGNDRYNQKLSERRANAVKAYLVEKGIASNRIQTEGAGETKPIASNNTEAGRADNRRVEVEVIK